MHASVLVPTQSRRAGRGDRPRFLPGARTCAAFGPRTLRSTPSPHPLSRDRCEARAKAGLLGGHSGPAARRLGRQGLSPEAGHTGQLLSHTC